MLKSFLPAPIHSPLYRLSLARFSFFPATSSLSLFARKKTPLSLLHWHWYFHSLAAVSATCHISAQGSLGWHNSPHSQLAMLRMAASRITKGAPLSSPSSLAWLGAGWFYVDEQVTGGSGGGHSGLSNPVTRANWRQQQGIGCA